MRENIYFIVLTQPNSSELWNINTIMISYQFSYVYWSSQANIYLLPVWIEEKKTTVTFPKSPAELSMWSRKPSVTQLLPG